MNDQEELKANKKQTHPLKKSSFISKFLFCWCIKELYRNYKQKLTKNDLYENLEEHNAKMLGDKLENMWLTEIELSAKPSLAKVLLKFLGWKLVLNGVIFLLWELSLTLGLPLLTFKILEIFSTYKDKKNWQDLYIYIFGVFCVFMLKTIVFTNLCVSNFSLGIKLRVACSVLIFKTALTIRKKIMQEMNVGHIVNLLSNDVRRFDVVLLTIHYIWIAPIDALISLLLFYIYFGKETVFGSILLLTYIPFQSIFSIFISNRRKEIATKTDSRIRLINDIICGIQVIKMYAWEKAFIKVVDSYRKLEIDSIFKSTIIKLIAPPLKVITTRTCLFVYILACYFFNKQINLQIAFSSVVLYELLRTSITGFLPHAVTNLSETMISIKRIQEFLMKNKPENRLQLNKKISNLLIGQLQINDKRSSDCFIVEKSTTHHSSVNMKSACFKWSSYSQTIDNISLEVHSGEMVAVIGSAGSGKSTLLQLLTETLKLDAGILTVSGTMSYASQEPWIFSASVRQNIIFNQEFDVERYNTVIKVCALTHDLELFPYGDQTLVGERGVMLSGGQKARINLARAVYKNADIYLLDDPLAAIDAHVSREIFEDCLSKFLQHKCIIWITNQLHFLPNTTRIYYLEQGSLVAEGNYNDILKLTHFQKLSHQIFQNEKQNNSGLDFSQAATHIKSDKPNKAKEILKDYNLKTVIGKYCRAGGYWSCFLGVCTISLVIQILGTLFDFFISFWMNLEDVKNHNSTTDTLANFRFTTNTSIMIAGIILSFLLLTNIILIFTLATFIVKASSNLHNLMTNRVCSAAMTFFNTTPAGQILNRFSKDIGSIDEILPYNLLYSLQLMLHVVGIVVFISYVNLWLLLPSIVFLLVCFLLVYFYSQSNKNILRVEAAKYSPLYSHLAAALQGLTTIKVAGAQSILENEFNKYQDDNTVVSYLASTFQFAFRLWVDIISNFYIVIIFFFIFINEDISLSKIGVSIMQIFSIIGTLQWCLLCMAELDLNIVAIERITEYTDLKSETDKGQITPPESWPLYGFISFQSVCLKYPTEKTEALTDVTFSVKNGEKIGIIGRTGAGKSSLVAVLVRLFDFEGDILIDNVNIKDLPLKNLRSRISVIPQDPVLFSGSLRQNLDFLDQYTDENIWAALNEVELKDTVQKLPLGLNTQIVEKGGNFSNGQRQLLCLTRIVLQKPKIIVFDEATANIDVQTDATIQKTIKNKFRHSTVLTIAHRLNTVIDSDKILVMNDGRVAEFGTPTDLLKNTESLFYKNLCEYKHAITDSLTISPQIK